MSLQDRRYTEKLRQQYQVGEKHHPCFFIAVFTVYSFSCEQAMLSFWISEKQVFSVRVSKRPVSSLHRAGGQRKKGLSQTLHEDAVAAGVELHSLNAALIFCNARAQQRTHLFICVFMMCFSMPLFCSFWGWWKAGQVLYNTCIYIICVLQKITGRTFSKRCFLESF